MLKDKNPLKGESSI
jgi:hypothetical protein